MTNPLDDSLDTYVIARDALKVVRRVLDNRANPVANTTFYGRTPDEGHEMLKQAEEQLEQLIAFSMFAAFERSLRDYVGSRLSGLADGLSAPEPFAQELEAFILSGVDYWRLDQVLDLFQPIVGHASLSEVKNLRSYRHHVAHGVTPPTTVLPQTAYRQLTQFLDEAGIVRRCT